MKGDVPAACRIKVTLSDVRPPIWRRIEIASNVTFKELHDILQVVMGWTNSHLHVFEVGDQRIGVPDAEAPDEVPEKNVFLGDVLKQGTRRFRYDYDFGDGWEHDLEVEELFEPEPGTVLPRCIGGKRSGPPEDVGGPHGYVESLAAFANSRHPRHREFADWFPRDFDPERFDLESINQRLNALGKLRPRSRPRSH